MTVSGFSLSEYALLVIFAGSISQLWPLLVLPALAALVSDRAARMLPPTKADWRVAALLAAFPGVVMLALATMVASRATRHMHLDDLSHFATYHLSLVACLAVLGRAAWRAWGRHRALRDLTACAVDPSPPLRAAAVATGVSVRELPDEGRECFVAGVIRPVAFVSSNLAKSMTEAELRAALHHERAHAASHDPAMLALLSFLRDLAPGSDRALTAYRQSRERRADEEAARKAGPCALASALIAAARPKPLPMPAIAMAGPDAGTWRLQAILGTEVEPMSAPQSWMPVWAGIMVNIGLASWPLPHLYMVSRLCTC